MKKALIILVMPFVMMAGNLQLVNGKIKAHTEVMGDKTIDPATSQISTKLKMGRGITSIKGKVSIGAKSLVSDNKSRDEHMYETLKTKEYKTISYTIDSIKSSNGKYQLIGKLNFAGVTNPLSVMADISQSGKNINLSSNFAIKLTDYGLKPPKMLFLTVRDQIDIRVKLKLKG